MSQPAITLEDIERIPKDMLNAEDVAGYLECKPHSIRVQAQDNPTMLGFPVMVSGSRVKIPKAGFIFYMKYGRPVIT